MADSLNRFFQEAGNQLNDALGNPRAQQRPGLNDPGHPSNRQVNNRTGAPDGKALIALQENLYGETKIQSPGFTPVEYYRTVSSQYSGENPVFEVIPPLDWEHRNTKDVYYSIAGQIPGQEGSYVKYGDYNTRDFKFGYDYSNIFFDNVPQYTETLANTISDEQKFSKISRYNSGDFITPHDNEDPVYFGFDVKINALSSPLLNGALEQFLTVDWTDSLDDEILGRREIYAEFKRELTKYFDFNINDISKYRDNGSRISNGDYGSPESTAIPGGINSVSGVSSTIESIFGSRDFNKKYYLKKIDGLQKLNESNTAGAQAAFTKYQTDLLKFTFYEDTTLNMGTLYSLYKLLYWSRLRGKSMIPENLLRFDMTITVSELRNFVAVKKASPENQLELLRANLSKYVYNVYECQFFFQIPTHPDSINMGERPVMTDDYTIDISYKYSSMNFVRYNPSKEAWGIISNVSEVPGPSRFETVTMGSTPNILPTIVITGFNLDDPNIKLGDSYPLGLKDEETFTQDPNNLGDFAKNAKQSATSRLLEGLKSAALNEAQRQLNTQFSLLNNTIDEIRTNFGIGRIPPPTNVYQIPPGGQFFFDVQNSLRNFGGDVLSNFFFGQ